MRLALVLGFAVFCSPAFGQHLDRSCKDREVFSRMLAELEVAANKITDEVESVPPSDAEYIRQESKSALRQKNQKRFSIVAGSRYYAALQLHDDMKVVIDNIKAASGPSLNHAAIYLSVVVARLGDVTSSLTSYIDRDSARAEPVLTRENRQELYFLLPALRSQALIALQCAIGSIE